MEFINPGVSNIHSLLSESVAVYKSTGHKAKLVNIGASVKRDVMFWVHVSDCPEGCYEGF